MSDPESAVRVAELKTHLLRAAVRVQKQQPLLTGVEVLTALVEVAEGVRDDMRRGGDTVLLPDGHEARKVQR